MKQLDSTVLDCLTRSGITYRRGAVRVLNTMPMIEALEELCDAINDADQEIRITATHALQKRGDLRACIALLAHLNDEDERFRSSVQRAVVSLLENGGLLSSGVSEQLALPMDMATYANEVITTGRMQGFEGIGNPYVGKFLTGLAAACIHNNQSLPQLLTALDTLATYHITADRTSISIGLTIALICANILKEKQRWQEALSMYHHAVTLARRADAPQIEWRSWYAAGTCFEALKDDQAALTAFRNAMAVIDRLWFLLLEEDKLRNFFQDKTLLYDRASICALRLGYSAIALECGEKGKTRYLGDLIARRQMDPRVVLNRDIKEFWENIGRLRSSRVPLGAPGTRKTERVEVVAVQADSSEPGVSSVKPERLAALEEVSQHNKELQNRLGMIRRIWQLVAYLSTTEDDFYHQYVEDLYQSLLPVYQAMKSAALPLPREEQSSIISQYNDAARALNRAGQGRQDVPFWVFEEYRGWVTEVCNATEDDESTLLLDAVMEALNAVLHHEPVFGIATDAEDDSQSLVFVTRTFNRESTDPSRGTMTIETPLELRTQPHWRYISRIARGEIVAYRDIADTLYGRPKVAQLQFLITEDGTIVFVSHRTATMRKRAGALPDLHGEDDLHVFTNPDVTLSSLRQLLLESEESWFVRYRNRNQEEGLQAWMKAMDATLQWVYSHLFAPLDVYLKEKGVQRLRIIPHRALHLIPFAALFSTDESGQRHYLIDDYDIEYAPSATLQHICRERARGRSFQRSLTAIANPTGDLPFASTEVGQAMSHFPAANVQLLEGNNARIAAIAPAVSASVFHFAGHGHYDWDDPLASDLLFARGEHLSLADLFAETLSMPATMLVVLSACETNITNPEDLADEYLGLASGFLFAGTPSVVSTLWTVNDISTSLLMQQFYQLHFKEGLHASRALRGAQRWLRDTVNPAFLLEYIQSQLATLERQRKQISYLKMADPIDAQIRRLQTLLKVLRYQEKKRLNKTNPYAHPYYWAAFTINTG
jgi:CHAT domain-containing protein